MDGYRVSDAYKTTVRAIFDLTDNDVRLQVNLLKEWAKCNDQLPVESQDEDYLNIMLLRSKFQEDLAKKNIENYFKGMSCYPEVFKKLFLLFKYSEEVGVAVATPIPTPKFERIGVMKLMLTNMTTKKFDINQMIVVCVTTGMIMYNNDYIPSVRFVLDFEGITLFHVLKVNLRDLFKLVWISENILRIRISGIELLNAPRIITAILGIARLVLKPKMFSRITVHNDLSSLHKSIPLECLPSDYGGEAENTDQLVEKWDHIVESHQSFFQKIANLSQGNKGNKNIKG